MTAGPGRGMTGRRWLFAALALLLLQIAVLYAMGRVPICECGYVKLFEPEVNSPGNSQHLADWYTPSHIIHGFLFYGLGFLILRRAPLSARLTLAVFIEAAWEIAENSPLVIDRYRTATMALGYAGDSIINSAMDTVFMVLGFLFASRAPVWLTVVVAIFFELFTGWLIRDNLSLNVLMLVWPVEAIRQWQSAI
ncbi:membrane protein [Neorhizobium sp. NCHU2750]|nr:membrane protein [Neorhizobium sp. NCHU2750]